jgi:uncharacterized protein YvpB
MQGEGCFDFDTCYDQIFKSLGYQRKSSSLEEIQENLRKNQMVMVSIVPDSNLFNKKGKKIPKEKWQRHSIVIIGFDNTGIDRLESRKDGCYKYHQPYESFLREWNRIGGEQRVSRLAIIKKN